MEARALRKYIRSSPKKMRVVVNAVRGKSVQEAMSILHFMPQAASEVVERTVKDAVFNLLHKYQDERPNEDELVIREIRVDGGSMFKRFQPAPRGRAHPILKRTSHLTVVVGTPEQVELEEDI